MQTFLSVSGKTGFVSTQIRIKSIVSLHTQTHAEQLTVWSTACNAMPQVRNICFCLWSRLAWVRSSGCGQRTIYCKWNYVVRVMYPRTEHVDRKWSFMTKHSEDVAVWFGSNKNPEFRRMSRNDLCTKALKWKLKEQQNLCVDLRNRIRNENNYTHTSTSTAAVDSSICRSMNQ